MKFGVCDFSRFAVTDYWRLRGWRLWCLALMTATRVGLPKTRVSFYCVLRVYYPRLIFTLKAYKNSLKQVFCFTVNRGGNLNGEPAQSKLRASILCCG